MQHLAIDSKARRLYTTSTQTDEVLVFDLTGKKIASLRPRPPDKLEGASALVLVNRTLYVLCTFGNRVVQSRSGREIAVTTSSHRHSTGSIPVLLKQHN